MKSATKNYYILNIKALCLAVSEKKIFFAFFLIISLSQIMTPPGRGLFRPQGSWLEGIMKGIAKHCYTQNIKALGLMRRIFVCFYYYTSMGANDPGACPIWTPGA